MMDIFFNNLIYKILVIVSLCLVFSSFLIYQYLRHLYKNKELGRPIKCVLNFVEKKAIESVMARVKIAGVFLRYSAILILCVVLYTAMIIEVQLAIYFFEIFCSGALSYYFAFLIVITVNWFTSFWPLCKILDYCKSNEIIDFVKYSIYNWVKSTLFLLAIVIVVFLNDISKIKLLELDNFALYDIAIRAIGSSVLVAIIIDRFFQHLKAVKLNQQKNIEKNKKDSVIKALNGYRDNLKEKLSDDELILLNSYIFHLKLAVSNREYFDSEEISCYIDKLKYYRSGITICLHSIEEFFKDK